MLYVSAQKQLDPRWRGDCRVVKYLEAEACGGGTLAASAKRWIVCSLQQTIVVCHSKVDISLTILHPNRQ